MTANKDVQADNMSSMDSTQLNKKFGDYLCNVHLLIMNVVS